MPDIKDDIFKSKRLVEETLLPYGFAFNNEIYEYTVPLHQSGLELSVQIKKNGNISTSVTDTDTRELYTLHLTENALGGFAASVRAQYEKALTDIADKCFTPDVFKAKQALEIIDYAFKAYGDRPEYLWKKFPENAVLRRSDTKKWYAAFLTVDASKLGLKCGGRIEILDLRVSHNEIEGLTDGKSFFPGYHMNKKHWITLLLDNSIHTEKITEMLKNSYAMAK